MSLIALPAFLLRRREDTPTPDTTAVPTTDVEVVKEVRVRHWDSKNPTARDARYVHRCLGCDANGAGAEYSHVFYARDEANKHAAACWSMPKPGAKAGEA